LQVQFYVGLPFNQLFVFLYNFELYCFKVGAFFETQFSIHVSTIKTLTVWRIYQSFDISSTCRLFSMVGCQQVDWFHCGVVL